MAKLLLLSVLTLPLLFHLSYADALSDGRLDDDNTDLSNKDARQGRRLILDNERRMTTKFDAKIRSKNYDRNDDGGRMEERAKLLRTIENQRVVSRDARREERVRRIGTEIHSDRSSLRQGERRVRHRENKVSRVENSDARVQDTEKRFRARELMDVNGRREKLMPRRISDERRSRTESRRTERNVNEERDESSRTESEKEIKTGIRRLETASRRERSMERLRSGSHNRIENRRFADEKRKLENERTSDGTIHGSSQNQDRRLRSVERQNDGRDERRVRSQLRRDEERDSDDSRRDFERRVKMERENRNVISNIVRTNAAERTRFSNEDTRSVDQERRTEDDSRRSFAREERRRIERVDASAQTIRDEPVENKHRQEPRDSRNRNNIRQERGIRDQPRQDKVRNEDSSRRETEEIRNELKGLERISEIVRNNADERSQYNRRMMHKRLQDNEVRNRGNTKSARETRYRNERVDISSERAHAERNDNERRFELEVSEEPNRRVEERRFRVRAREDVVRNDGSLRRGSEREEEEVRTNVERISEIVRNNVKERSSFNSRQNRRSMESQDRRDLRLVSRVLGDETTRRNERRLTTRRREDMDVNETPIRREREAMHERRNLDRVSNAVRRNVNLRASLNNRRDTRRSEDQEVRNEEGNFRKNSRKVRYDDERIEPLNEATRRERQSSERRLESRLPDTQNEVRYQNRYRANPREDAARSERDSEIEPRREMRSTRRDGVTITRREEFEEAASRRSIQRSRENGRYVQDSTNRRGEQRRAEEVRDRREDNWQTTLRKVEKEENMRDGRRLDNEFKREINDNDRRSDVRLTRNERQLESKNLAQASRFRSNKREESRQERNNRDDERINREHNSNGQRRRVLETYNRDFDNNDRRNVNLDNERSTREGRRQEVNSRRRIESDERSEVNRVRVIERRRSDDSRNINRNPDVRRQNQREARDDRVSDARSRLESTEERRNAEREDRVATGIVMEKPARHDALRREARLTPRMASREDNTERRLDDASRFATNRKQERRTEREYVNKQENRYADRRLDTQNMREVARTGKLESRRDSQGERIINRNDARRMQNERRDDLDNVRRSDETRISDLFRKEDYTINHKYFDGSSFLSNPSDGFLKMSNVMKLGSTMLDNMDTTLFTQILLGGVTMALMWNKKQIHGGF